MAKTVAPRPGAPREKASAGGLLVGLLILTAIAGSGGSALGWFIAAEARNPPPGPVKDASVAARAPRQDKLDTAVLVPLAPIVVSLASDSQTWIRLEASLVVEERRSDIALLSGKVSEDLAAFLKTVTLPQIEGASGFLFLRDDLNDRVRQRSDAKVRELMIRTLAVE